MGKNGALLRAQKQKNVVYTYTKEQLAERDNAIREDWSKEFAKRYSEKLIQEAKEKENELKAFIDKQYNEMDKYYFDKDNGMRTINWMQCFIAIGIDVLDEIIKNSLKWKDVKRIAKVKDLFMDGVTDRINMLANDYSDDLKSYSDRLYKKHGLLVDRKEVEE